VTLSGPAWEYDHQDLCDAFSSRTKAIIINTPNNPTGKVFSRRELAEIAELCVRHDVYAITDEIYEHILYDAAEHVSMASLPGMADRTITINSLSKTYSVTGWRVGWAIASKTITSRIRKVHDFLTVGAPTPLQHAGVAALGFHEGYYRRLADSYVEARMILCDALLECGFRFTRPSGAYYVLADIAGLMPRLQANDDTDFAIKLLHETGVACVPGSSFYANPAHGATQVRFAFCKRHSTLWEVSRRFTRFFTAL
jgi:aminotransferase